MSFGRNSVSSRRVYHKDRESYIKSKIHLFRQKPTEKNYALLRKAAESTRPGASVWIKSMAWNTLAQFRRRNRKS